jgi:hypothetical protein
MSDPKTQIDFNAPAILTKWPSRSNKRIRATEDAHPYSVSTGTLDECIQRFKAKPTSQQHLYEIHTRPQTTLVTAVLSPEHIGELSRLRDFL